LREVAQVTGRLGLELLCIEPERRGDAEQALHQVTGALLFSDDRQSRNEPERADQECALLAGEAVVGFVGLVAEDEPVLGQLLGYGQDCLVQAIVVPRQEAEERRQQRRGVQRIGVVVLSQHSAIAHATRKDVLPDLVRRGGPGRLQVGIATNPCKLCGAIQGDPAHQLGGDVVLRRTSRLPDALVRVLPNARGALGLRLNDRPQPSRQPLALSCVNQD
jgi:hypothetical protein